MNPGQTGVRAFGGDASGVICFTPQGTAVTAAAGALTFTLPATSCSSTGDRSGDRARGATPGPFFFEGGGSAEHGDPGDEN